MKNFLMVLVFATALWSCDKEDDPIPPQAPTKSDLKLQVKAHFNGLPVNPGQVFLNVSSYRVNVIELKLYLSEIYAVKNDGQVVSLSDVALFNVTTGSDEIIFKDVDIASYQSLGFGIGVPPEMNSPDNPDFDESVFSSDHPLSVTNNMFWSWASGYRFVIFDGKYDTDGTGSGPLLNGYSFHTGKDASYREVVFSDASFSVDAQTDNAVTVSFNMAEFFYSESDTIDIAVDNQTHGENQVLSDRLSDNIQQSVSFGE